MRGFEIVGIAVLLALVVGLVLWVRLTYRRRKRAEQPRLRLADLKLPVEDWRVLVPPEWRTDETHRLLHR